MLHIHFHKASGHYTWQGDDLSKGAFIRSCNMTQIVTLQIKNVHFFISSFSPRTKSYDLLIIWSYVVLWQTKNVIFPIPKVLWTQNLIRSWLIKSNHHSKNHITLSFFIYIVFSPSNVPLILAIIRLSLLVRFNKNCQC